MRWKAQVRGTLIGYTFGRPYFVFRVYNFDASDREMAQDKAFLIADRDNLENVLVTGLELAS